MTCRVSDGCSSFIIERSLMGSYMIKRGLFKNRIPARFICNVFDHHEIEVGLPLRMESKNSIASSRMSNSSSNVMIGFDESIDDMGS